MIIIEEDNAPDTYVKESLVEGYGLFASKDFKPKEIVIDYGLFSDSWYQTTYDKLSKEKKEKSAYIMLDGINCITSDKISKFGYLNHSRNPNCICIFKKRIVVANKNIQKDEELFIDYRLEYRPNDVSFPSWI